MTHPSIQKIVVSVLDNPIITLPPHVTNQPTNAVTSTRNILGMITPSAQ